MTSRPRRQLAPLAHGLLHVTGITASRRRRRSNRGLVLCYHAVVADAVSQPEWTQVRLSEFRRQMEYLRLRYRVVPLLDIIECVKAGRSLPEGAAAITFDDGYRNNYTCAFPVLREMGLPATIFLTTGFLDGGVRLWADRLTRLLKGTTCTSLDFCGERIALQTASQRVRARDRVAGALKRMPKDEKDEWLRQLEGALGPIAETDDDESVPLRWDDVRTMQATGLMSFGAHTVSHEILTGLTPHEQHSEIARSRERVHQETATSCVLFAYPNGGAADFDATTVGVLRDLGMRAAVTAIPGLVTPGVDPYAVPRIPIGAATSVAKFAFACTAGGSADRGLWG